MTRIAQAIDINVPVHIAYEQLRHFESYPSFMHGVASVRMVDDTHLHWAAHMQDKDIEWDAEVTEQLPDRCIAWRNTSGPQSAGRIELQTVDPQRARVTLTMDCEPAQMIGAADGNVEAALQRQLADDLARFKHLVESQGSARQGSAQFSSPPQADQSTQSSASLSQQEAEDDDSQGVFSVAEEQNFDEQSAQARRVGQMPEDGSAAGPQGTAETNPSSAVAKSMKPTPSKKS